MRRVAPSMLLLLMLAASCAGGRAPQTTAVTPGPSPSRSTGTAAEAIAQDGRFTTMIELLGGFHGRMGDAGWNGTLLAPTDATFQALEPGVLDRLRSDEHLAERTAVIRTHILQMSLTPDRFEDRSVVTAHGQDELDVVVDGTKVRIGDALVVETIMAANGVIHVIDRVLGLDALT